VFIRTAQEQGLYVILRPGPYVCAEWDLRGLPSWLFADPNMVLRSGDETFLGPTRRWLQRLGREVAPLQSTRGGPIIAVQVENEYGSFGNDKDYMKCILAALRSAGLGEALLYIAEGGNELQAELCLRFTRWSISVRVKRRKNSRSCKSFGRGARCCAESIGTDGSINGAKNIIGPTRINKRKNWIGS
jgi:Glycosyl hydrolases family 35